MLAEARAGWLRGTASQSLLYGPEASTASGRTADVPGPFGSASAEQLLAAWPPPTRAPAKPDPALAYPRHTEVPPSDIIVERRRRFGDRLFRLWVEDCAFQGGVRVHAMDVLSLCRSHVDLRDCDVQAMFNHFVGRCCDKMVRWIAGEAESNDSDHDRELR